VMMLHRVRLMLNRQRTQLSNAMRAHMSEFGVVAPVGRIGLERLLTIVADRDDLRIPADAHVCLEMLAAQLAMVKEQVLQNDRRIRANARETEIGAVSWRSPVSARCLPARSLPALLILACSERVVTWPHGSALYPSKTRAAARSVSAASRDQATATFDTCR
jgi:hypothetical protein